MSETFEIARKNMVINQLRPNKIKEENILRTFENTPKENYLDASLIKNCYLDKNLDIIDNRGYLKNLHLAQIIKYLVNWSLEIKRLEILTKEINV